jgi:hypothetical protein
VNNYLNKIMNKFFDKKVMNNKKEEFMKQSGINY